MSTLEKLGIVLIAMSIAINVAAGYVFVLVNLAMGRMHTWPAYAVRAILWPFKTLRGKAIIVEEDGAVCIYESDGGRFVLVSDSETRQE